MSTIVNTDSLDGYSFSFDEDRQKINTTKGIKTLELDSQSYKINLVTQDETKYIINLKESKVHKTIDKYVIPSQSNLNEFDFHFNTESNNFNLTDYLSGDFYIDVRDDNNSDNISKIIHIPYIASVGTIFKNETVKSNNQTKTSEIRLFLLFDNNNVTLQIRKNTGSFIFKAIYFRGHGL